MPFTPPRPLTTDGRSLGLRTARVPTRLGPVALRHSPRIDGPAVVLLHGAAGSWTTWTPLIAASAAAGRPVRNVVAIDLPGWGESTSARPPERVADLSGAVLDVVDALGYGSWRVVGHSLGAAVALDLAAREPRRTLDVTMVSPSGPAELDAVRRPIRGGAGLPGFAGMLLAMRVLAGLGRAGGGIMTGLGRFGMLRTLSSPLFAGPVDPTVVDALAREVRPRAFAHAARIASDYDERVWSAIEAPVRSVRGERDVFASARDAEALRLLIPDFAETRLSGAGHFAHIERPDAVLEVMRPAGDPAAATP